MKDVIVTDHQNHNVFSIALCVVVVVTNLVLGLITIRLSFDIFVFDVANVRYHQDMYFFIDEYLYNNCAIQVHIPYFTMQYSILVDLYSSTKVSRVIVDHHTAGKGDEQKRHEGTTPPILRHLTS